MFSYNVNIITLHRMLCKNMLCKNIMLKTVTFTPETCSLEVVSDSGTDSGIPALSPGDRAYFNVAI